jgi:hypothetical protein
LKRPRPGAWWQWWLPESLSGRVLLTAFLAAGSVLRLADVGPALLFGDELHSLGDMLGGYPRIFSHFSETGGGLALPLFQRLLLDFFGDSHWIIRAPAWLPGLALLVLTFPIARRQWGETTALAATALVAVSPLLVFYAHFGRIYSLVALLCLLLYDRLAEWSRRANERPRAGAGLIVLTTLLPWAHPTALGFLLPAYAGALLACGLMPNRSAGSLRRAALHLAGALALGGLLCLLAYWPARESLAAFLAEKTRAEYYGAFGPLDVASLVMGSRSAFIGLALLVAAGTWAALREAPGRGVLLLFAAIGPGLAIACIQPYGDAYAYARYVMPSVALLCLLAGRGLSLVGETIPFPGRGAVPWASAALALIVWLTGPLGPGQPRAAEHANTYLSLLALPAFDAPWPETPSFYRDLAARPAGERADLRLLEVPALTTRTRHLYRHYQVQHGVPSLLAPLPGEFPRIPHGPYTAFQRPGWQEDSDADFLVVHLDVAEEIAGYWRWLYGPQGPGPFPAREEAFMERHRRYGGLLPRPSAALLEGLRDQLGEPLRAEDGLVIWQLRKSPAESD